MGKKGPLWWRESDWLLRGSSAANQILLRHSGPILSEEYTLKHNIMTLPQREHILEDSEKDTDTEEEMVLFG